MDLSDRPRPGGHLREQRFTRLLGGFHDWQPGVRAYYFSFDTRWPWVQDDTIYCLARHQKGYYYQTGILFDQVVT